MGFRFLGVRFRFHPTLAVLFALAAAGGLLLEAVLLLLVLLTHELAHLVAARCFGVEVEAVDILPFGGVARMRGLGVDPAVEAVVALAGPVHSLALAGLGTVLTVVAAVREPLLQLFVQGNLGLGLFNLIPALPLDGGRLSRALLARRLGDERATRLLAVAGQVAGVGLVAAGLVGLVTDRPWPNGFVLGGFLFFAARREATGLRLARWHRLWSPPPALARGAVAVRVLAVPGSLRVAAALRYLAADSYVVFVVLDERGRAVGVVDEGLLREEASSGRSAVSLREVVQRGGGGL